MSASDNNDKITAREKTGEISFQFTSDFKAQFNLNSAFLDTAHSSASQEGRSYPIITIQGEGAYEQPLLALSQGG